MELRPRQINNLQIGALESGELQLAEF